MKKPRNMSIVALLAKISLAPLAAGLLLASAHSIAQAQAASSKLGDLSPFRSIVVDAAKMVDKGDLASGKARIKDLETSWDDAEPSSKPRSAADWHIIDKAIDRALAAYVRPRPTTPGVD